MPSLGENPLTTDYTLRETKAPSYINGLLSWGSVNFHVSPDNQINITTSEVWKCDVVVLLNILPDGTTNVRVSHYGSPDYQRVAHAIIIETSNKMHYAPGEHYAIIYTSYKDDPSWPNIKPWLDRRAAKVDFETLYNATVTYTGDPGRVEIVSYRNPDVRSQPEGEENSKVSVVSYQDTNGIINIKVQAPFVDYEKTFSLKPSPTP